MRCAVTRSGPQLCDAPQHGEMITSCACCRVPGYITNSQQGCVHSLFMTAAPVVSLFIPILFLVPVGSSLEEEGEEKRD